MSLAVVGLGAMGWNHARVAAQAGTLSRVFDQDAKRAQEAAKAFGAAPAPTLEAAVRDPAVEAVIVATPTSTHHVVALAAIQAGKHVLVEKPIAGDLASARTLIDAARAQGVTLAVGHVERHNPVVQYAAGHLAAGTYGALLSLSATRVSTFPGRVRDVGCLLDIGIHDIDIVCSLAGAPVENVFARTGMRKTAPFEDHAQVLLTFRNGLGASIETNWLTPMRVRRLGVTCTDAHLELDYMEQIARISRAELTDPRAVDLSSVPLEYTEQRVILRRQEPLALEQRDFLAAARSRRAPLVTGEDGLRAVAIAQAAILSGRERRSVALDDVLAGERL